MAKSKFKITGLSKKAEKRLSKSLKLAKKNAKEAGYDDSELTWSQEIDSDSSTYIEYNGTDKLTGIEVYGSLYYNKKGTIYSANSMEFAPTGSPHDDIYYSVDLEGSKGYDKLSKWATKNISSSKHIKNLVKAAGKNEIIDSTDVDRFAALIDSYPGIVPNDPLSTYVAIGDSYAFA